MANIVKEFNRNIWGISDTHFNHANIIRYCNRPFWNVSAKDYFEPPGIPDTELMDETMIANWNAVVKPNDIIYHLGDVYFGALARGVLARLMGRKRLILGNHDDGKDPHLQAHFQKIMIWRMFPEFGLLLTHVPVHDTVLNPNKCPVNVHGHIHNNYEIKTGKHINISVEVTDYKPVNLEDLRVK